ncbi:MAG: hypothetical protein HY812_00440 [Planctomycetes bacterium]|nr:hypothetical protein [Planctomycetota bacterium]
MKRLALLLALSVCASAPPSLFAQCGTPGTGGTVPRIEISSDLWDASTTFTLKDALPGAGWAWLMDFSPGPLPTPYGTFCVGPAFFVLFNFLGGSVPIGPNGRLDITFDIPPSVGAAIGVPLFCQGIIVDPAGQNGLALTNGLPFALRSPRVFIASDQGRIDVIDAYGASLGAPAPLLDSFAVAGSRGDFALSRDRERLYARINGSGSFNSVKAYDITQSPPALLGEAVAGTTSLTGKPRNGVVVSHDDRFGYFVDDLKVHKFDADPVSPTFMSVLASGVSSVAGISLALSPDDQTLFVSAGTGSPGVIYLYDTFTMQETIYIQMTDNTPFFGLALRYSIGASPSGKYLATIQQGILVGSPALDGLAMLNVIALDPLDPAYLTEIAAVPLPDFGQLEFVFDPKDPSDATVYTVASDASGAYKLQVINWMTGQVASLPLGDTGGRGNEDGGIGMTPNGAYLFATARGADMLHVFDANLNQVGATSLASSGKAWFIHVEE